MNLLSPPFESAAVLEALRRIGDQVQQNPPSYESTDSVFAFLPAKAGSGATTIAVNTSLAIARMKDTKVLLADLDLNSGLVGFMLSLNDTPHSIVDAAENSADLDENLWPKDLSRPRTIWTSFPPASSVPAFVLRPRKSAIF